MAGCGRKAHPAVVFLDLFNDSLRANMITYFTMLPTYAGPPEGPKYQTPGASGFDVTASSERPEYIIRHGAVTIIPTGIKIGLPPGYEAQVRARGGLAAKHGVMVVNGPGTVDSDYRGEVMVLLSTVVEAGTFVVKPGDRIAQLVITEYTKMHLAPVSINEYECTTTTRGEGRFGSTGTR